MGNFILAVLVPFGSKDPVDYVEQAMRPYAGEANKTDGWEVLEWQWSPRVDATPDAYITLDGSWHERCPQPYPEESERSLLLSAITQAHLAQFGSTELGQLRQKRDAVPPAVTAWYREWESVTGATTCLIVFIWCHV